MESERRVVVTGMGVISPIGLSTDEFWANLCAGRSGVSTISLFDASTFPTRIAAEVRGFEPRNYVARRKSLKVMMRDMQFAVAATKEAAECAHVSDAGIDPVRMGVLFGAGMICTDLSELAPVIEASIGDDGRFDLERFGREGIAKLFPLWLLKQLPNMLASHVSIIYNAQGPSNTITTGCSASAHAIGESFRIISRGMADIVITGGASSRIDPLKLVRYHKQGVLSKMNDEPEKASRPFDARRDGFVVGEGAGVLVLEEYEHARARGAPIRAEVLGFGSSVDMQSSGEWGVGAVSKACAMRMALRDAGIEARDVEYINAHGNSIPFTDALETEAIKQVWGPAAYETPVSSIKGHIGDLGAACGAVGVIASALALENGVIPPTLNHTEKDEMCDLDYVPVSSRRAPITTAACNSFDFMGQNVSLVVRKAGI